MGLLGLGCWTAWRRRSAAAGQALLVPVPLLLPLLATTWALNSSSSSRAAARAPCWVPGQGDTRNPSLCQSTPHDWHRLVRLISTGPRVT